MINLDFFGQDAKFHHIGVAVKSIKDISPASEIIVDSAQKVRVALTLLYGIKLELLEPCGEDSPINGSLKKGAKLVHICYAVADIEKAIKECKARGFYCIAQPLPSAAFSGDIAWVYSRDYGLFELLQERKG